MLRPYSYTVTKQTNKHTPANAFGIGPAHKEQESQRSSLVTQTSVGLLCIYMKSPELCGTAFALAGTEPRGRFHTHVRSEMFADFKLSSYGNYLIFPFADLEMMTRWVGGG